MAYLNNLQFVTGDNMSITIETTSGLGRRIRIQVPAEIIEAAYKKRLNELKNVKMDGFRQGKVPAKIIEERFGKTAQYEAIDEIINEQLYQAFEKENISPVNRPSVEIKSFEFGKPLEFEATFEVAPKIDTLNDLNGVAVKQYEAKLTDDDVNLALNNLSKHHTNWHEVDRPATTNDQVSIEFERFINGKLANKTDINQTEIVLGETVLFPELEKGLMNLKAGDTAEIAIDDTSDPELAGKKVVFKVKVNKVAEGTLPELNDEFAKKFGCDKGIDELRERIKSSMQEELNNAVKNKNKNLLFDKFLELNEIEIPQSLIDSEAKRQLEMEKEHRIERSLPELPADVTTESFKAAAKEGVKFSFLLMAAAKIFNLEVSDADALARVEEMIKGHPHAEKMLAAYRSNEDYLYRVKMNLIEEKLLAKLLANVNIEQETVGYKQLLEM